MSPAARSGGRSAPAGQTRRAARLATPVMLLVLLAFLVLAGCKVDTRILVDVDGSGTGSITVSVGLDDDARAQLGQPFDESIVPDQLRQAGWEVVGPEEEGELTTLAVTHRFDSVDEANELLGSVLDRDGPFQDFTLSRRAGFFSTTVSFSGRVDFGSGLDRFVDTDLLSGPEFDGDQAGPIRERISQLQDEAFPVTVAVRLPGDVESNSIVDAENGAVWRPRVSDGEEVVLEATGEGDHTVRVVGALLVTFAVAALVTVGMFRFLLRNLFGGRLARTTPPST